MTKRRRYCDECVFVEFVKVEETGEFLTLCSKSMTRCTEERSGLFKDACGPTGKNFARDTVRAKGASRSQS